MQKSAKHRGGSTKKHNTENNKPTPLTVNTSTIERTIITSTQPNPKHHTSISKEHTSPPSNPKQPTITSNSSNSNTPKFDHTPSLLLVWVVSVFIVLFVGVQIYIPLVFYGQNVRWNQHGTLVVQATDVGNVSLHHHLQQYDERFAWRMFSSNAMNIRCQVGFSHTQDAAQFIDLKQIYFVGWIDLLDRCRESVILKITTDLCNKRQMSLYRTIVATNKKTGEDWVVEEPTVELCGIAPQPLHHWDHYGHQGGPPAGYGTLTHTMTAGEEIDDEEYEIDDA